jgi:hypothetical protein
MAQNASTADPALIHVGLHKTGTSWLQDRLPQRHGRDLWFQGPDEQLRRTLILPGLPDFDPAHARAALAPLTEAAATAGLPLVISDEALAGLPFHRPFLREVLLERIARTFPQAQLMITVREQAAVIHSMYGQYLRFGFTSSLTEFLAEPSATSSFQPVLDRAYYDYARLGRYLEQIGIAERAWIVPMEWMLADTGAFIAGIGARIGRDLPPEEEGAAARVVNPAWSPPAMWVARQANRFLAQDSRWQKQKGGPLYPNSLASRVDRMVPEATRRRLAARDRRLVKEMLGDRYAASNAALAERLGLDLSSHGYPMPGEGTGDR